jgi:peptidoglycan hydrolase-like protein with peptidoglycan-binding domain
VLTAQVESRVVSENVITRGKVLPSRHVEVSSAGLAGEAVRSVVTKGAGSPGSRVRIGSVLVEVSGRPVFALSGSLPAYRDLTTGDTGEDVAQLQRALAALGHSYGKDPLGTFGSGTARAVTALYEQAGYSALRAESVVAEHKDSDHEAVASPSTEPEARQVPLNEGHVLMPAAEAVYISGRDPRIDTVSATVGATAPDTLMTISAGTLMLQGTLELYQKDMVRVGSKVQVYSDSTGARATGTVDPRQGWHGRRLRHGAPTSVARPAGQASSCLLCGPGGPPDH